MQAASSYQLINKDCNNFSFSISNFLVFCYIYDEDVYQNMLWRAIKAMDFMYQ